MSLPNQLTTLRIILTPLFVYLLFSPDIQIKYISLLIFLFATLTDWYDGYFARKYGYVTLWGKFMDPLADKILVSAALFSLYYLQLVQLWMVIIIVIRDFLITGLRSYAMFRGQPVVTSQLAKIKTFAQMGVAYYILIIYILQLSFLPSSLIFKFISLLHQIRLSYVLMLIITFLNIYTAIQYFISNHKHLKHMLIDLIQIIRKK